MIYSNSATTVRKTLQLGKLGATVTYKVTGDAKFENNSSTISVTGLQDVGLDLFPNPDISARFVVVTHDSIQDAIFCVLCPATVIWNPRSASITPTASLQLTVLGTNPVTTPVTSLPTFSLDYMRELLITIDSFRSCCSFFEIRNGMRYTGDISNVLHIAQYRNADDTRVFVVVGADGTVRTYSHNFTLVSQSTFDATGVTSACLSGPSLQYLTVVASGTLMCFKVLPFWPWQLLFTDSSRQWLSVEQYYADASATAAVRCWPVSSVGFKFVPEANTLSQEINSRYCARVGTSSYDVELTSSGVRVNGKDYPVSWPVESNTDKVYMANFTELWCEGAKVADLQNVQYVIEYGGTVYAISRPQAQVPLTYVPQAPALNVQTQPSLTTLTVDIGVVGGDTYMPVVAPAGSTIYVNGTQQNVATANSSVEIIIPLTEELMSGEIPIAVGQSAATVTAVPDYTPNPFSIQNITGLKSGDSALTEVLTLTGFNMPIPVHSNGVILINGVEVPDGTKLHPSEDLRVRIVQSDNLFDMWWLQAGEVSTNFLSIQGDQPQTAGVRGRAYAPVGTYLSEVITNTYGERILFALLDDRGFIDGSDKRMLVLEEGESVQIGIQVTGHQHYDVSYMLGSSQHEYSVWADDHFLDNEVNVSAPRYTEGTLIFDFSSIPDDFDIVAQTPAGVRVIVNGTEQVSTYDARGYNDKQLSITFDSRDVVEYLALPNESGWPMEFGECTAVAHYTPTIVGNALRPLTLFSVSRSYEIADISTAVYAPANLIYAPYGIWSYALHDFQQVTVLYRSREDAQLQSIQFLGHDVGASAFSYFGTILPEYSAQLFAYISLHVEDVTGKQASAVTYLTQTMESQEFDPILNLTFVYGDPLYVNRAFSKYSNALATGSTVSSIVYTNAYDGAQVRGEVEYWHYGSFLHNRALHSLSYKASLDKQHAIPAIFYLHDLDRGQAVPTVDYWPKLALARMCEQEDKEVPLVPIERRILARWVNYLVPQVSTDYVKHMGSYEMLLPEHYAESVRNWARLYGRTYEQAGKFLGTLRMAYRYSPVAKGELVARKAQDALAYSTSLVAKKVEYNKHSVAIDFDAVVTQVHSSDWRSWNFVAGTSLMPYEERKVIVYSSMMHDGNPDMLDRGYFASELQALRNAIDVWKADPATIAARQIPSGEWYWITVDTCTNMCQGCPPYGYISGG